MQAEYDAVVVGSGPNGLAAGIVLQQQGLRVLIVEGKSTVGGGMRTEQLTLPGFHHDLCSAIHPLAIGSPFFRTLPLADFGLKFVQPTFSAAHPFDDGSAALLDLSIENTARGLGEDQHRYKQIIGPIAKSWRRLAPQVLGPFAIPQHPLAFARFGIRAASPATLLARFFRTRHGRGLWAGMAAHSMVPLNFPLTSAIAIVLLAAGHITGWPIAMGGSANIARALASYFESLGGKIQTNFFVTSLDQLPSARAILFDTDPRQLLKIAGHTFSSVYRGQLQRYRYGMGVFKIDWALDAPVPFVSEAARMAGTVHLGNTLEEIAQSERSAWRGRVAENPFVLLSQQSIVDHSRAPEGKHTAWGYCHVPAGSTADMTAAIEQQVERFAPGFRERILARHVMHAQDMEAYNPNYVGGDINGGAMLLSQLFTRPALRASPYRTSARGLYICSASTPPGGGVHGMCGYHAAARVLKDIFNLKPDSL